MVAALSATAAEAWQRRGGGSAVAALSVRVVPAWWRCGGGGNSVAAAAWMRRGGSGIDGGTQRDGGSSMAVAQRQRQKRGGDAG